MLVAAIPATLLDLDFLCLWKRRRGADLGLRSARCRLLLVVALLRCARARQGWRGKDSKAGGRGVWGVFARLRMRRV